MFGELKPEFPGVAEPRTRKSMGEHCEDMAREWSISRDSQDAWAASSHHKLAAAYERGFLDDLVLYLTGRSGVVLTVTNHKSVAATPSLAPTLSVAHLELHLVRATDESRQLWEIALKNTWATELAAATGETLEGVLEMQRRLTRMRENVEKAGV